MRNSVLLQVFIICSICLGVWGQSGSWAIIDNDFETIALANSFYADETGYVAGGTSSVEPLLLFTNNGGKNFTNQNLIGQNHAAFLSIDMYDSQNGVAGALGFIDVFACGAYTHDGYNWTATHDDFICTFLGCQAIDENNLVMIGQWLDIKDADGNGVMISTDGGSKWKQNNWNMRETTEAHYAWFESANYGYVSGGAYPSTSASNAKHIRRLTQRIHFNEKTRKFEVNTKPKTRELEKYIAILALATNEASTFTPLLNFTDQGFYFNEISCTDQNNCWLTAEGVNNLGDVSYIYHTNDGWQTYDVQLTAQGSGITAISMLTPTFGWAGGALLQGNTTGSFDGEFWLTQDGATWQLHSTIKNFYPFTISTTSTSYAYATGVTPIGLSSFASFAPNN